MSGQLRNTSRLDAWLDEAYQRLTEVGIDPEDAQVDVQWIAREVLGLSSVQLFISGDRTLNIEEHRSLSMMLSRRAQREPLSHILGEWEFWSLPFSVNSAALTPRPDTEVLIEEVLSWFKRSALVRRGASVIDLGTGTGCIGLSLAHERPELAYQLTDISADALALAHHNLTRLRGQGALSSSTAIELIEADLLKLSPPRDLIAIVSNPPYIKEEVSAELMPEVAQFEPHIALFGDDLDGLGHVRRIIKQAVQLLPAGGGLFLEVGYDQTEQTADLLTQHDFSAVKIRADYGGNPRVVWGVYSPQR